MVSHRRGYFSKIAFLVLLLAISCGEVSSQQSFAPSYEVTWTTLGKDHRDSMPIGNGEIGVNVWTEPSGDLLLLVGKTDSFTENGQLVKIGQVRIHLTPNPFVDTNNFRQTLKVREGLVTLTSDIGAELQVWVDANRPVIHAEYRNINPLDLKASVELWRTSPRQILRSSPEARAAFREISHPAPTITVDPDIVLPARPESISWFHRNTRSVYPETLANQHLASLLAKYPDPLLHLTFGALMKGPGLVSTDDRTLTTAHPVTSGRVDIHVLGQKFNSVERWCAALDELVARSETGSLEIERREHKKWWNDFWSRSWINVSGSAEAEAVTQGYAMQRWMMAAAGRGSLPVKFNGSIFTIGDIFSDGNFSRIPYDSSKGRTDPDFRQWGGNYWFQNQRLLYWPMIAAGDIDLLQPFFKMYSDDLPLARDRNRLIFHHAGASYPETTYFWGTPSNTDFGLGNPDRVMTNPYIRNHLNGGIELTAMMLDAYDYTQDRRFAQKTLVPIATEVTAYFDEHWKRVNGKILFDPSQSLETDRPSVNPAPDIAGLMSVLPRLIALPHDLTTPKERARWKGTFADLPPLPRGRTNREGKHPEPETNADPNGNEILWTAAKWTPGEDGLPGNSENPELYSVFPYRLFGTGLPDLDLARNTFDARRHIYSTCWGQDGIQAADLGWAERAKAGVTANFTAFGLERFQWFWKKGHDWEPDMDNGGAGQIILQSMLLQIRGDKILLFPAWPKAWDVDFKLHAPRNTTIRGRYVHGHLDSLRVTPAGRAKDVMQMEPQ